MLWFMTTLYPEKTRLPVKLALHTKNLLYSLHSNSMWRFEYQERGSIKCHAIIFNIKIGYIYSVTMSYEEDQFDWLNQMMCALDISDVSTEICSENKVVTESLTYGIRSIRQPKVVRVTAGPKQPVIDDNKEIKSQLAVLLESLDEEYASYLLPNTHLKEANHIPDPDAVCRVNNTEAVKSAVRAAFSGYSDTTSNNVATTGQINFWTYEDELKEASHLINKWKFVFQGRCDL